MPRPEKETRLNLLDFLLLISRRRVFLVANTVLWTAAAVAIVLFLPKSYTAKVVLMPPRGSSEGLSQLMKSLPLAKMAGGSSNLLQAGAGGENLENIYLAILVSRTLQEAVIKEFDLVKVYKFDKRKRYYVENVLEELAEHYGIEVNEEGTISIMVEDRDPRRCADMANFMARKLDEIYKTLSVETERNQRVFLEGRVALIKADLDSAERAYTAFLKENRMVDLDEQARATIETGSELEARYLASELKLDIARKVYAGSVPKIREQEMQLAELRKQRENLSKARSSDLFIPFRDAPELGLKLVRLKRDLKVQEVLFELMIQQYEHAKFEESKNTPTVQILDRAVPPQKRSRPKRSKIVIAVFFLSGVAGMAWILFAEYWRRFAAQNPGDLEKLRTIARNLRGRKPAAG